MNLYLILLTCILNFNVILSESEICPEKCECKRNNSLKGIAGLINIQCGKKEKISDFDELELLNIANEVIQLNLSDNLLTTFFPKVQLIALQKLDLSKNQITTLFNDQFAEVPNLRKLDLSNNLITHIEFRAFAFLKKLERLKLSHNQLKLFEDTTFNVLINLKQLDISNNPLICDCKSIWILDWIEKKGIKLASNPKCDSPVMFKGLSIRKLRFKDCVSRTADESPLIVSLNPSYDQIVFEGDTLKFECRAPVTKDEEENSITSKIEWFSSFEDEIMDADIKDHVLSSVDVMESTLLIPIVSPIHSGEWGCKYITKQGSYLKTVQVNVISENTTFCSSVKTVDNKGSYIWPQTFMNNTVTLNCTSLNANLDVLSQKASYYCSSNGTWQNLNTTACPYTSETTKILQQFSQITNNFLESVKLFHNYTANLTIFKDVVDLDFTAQTIIKYLIKNPTEQMGGVLVDVVNNLMNLPKSYIYDADNVFNTSSILLNATEQLAKVSSSSLLHKNNLALEEFSVIKDNFGGMKCTWYTSTDSWSNKLFYCVMNNQMETVGMQGKVTEASITIPKTLFKWLDNDAYNSKVYKILVAMHSSNRLLPIEKERRISEDVTSAVVGVKLVNFTVTNLTDPVYIMLRMPPSTAYELVPFTPVWWDPTMNNGSGGWNSEGCEFNHDFENHIVFSCFQFSYYGLLQDVSEILLPEKSSQFKFPHAAIIAGSSILIAMLAISIITYLFSYEAIQITKRVKHSLINTWLSIALLCFLYIFGIYQTEETRLCQMVGICLHYLSLSSILWSCVHIRCMHKKFGKIEHKIELHSDDLTAGPPIQKPILGLYLVGWGIGLIVCGISAAINIRDYSSNTYCFLRTIPSIMCLQVPIAILLLFIIVSTLLTRCLIYNIDVNGHLSEGTQATENVDLDLFEPTFPETRSVCSISSRSSSSEIEDTEHSPIVQLKGFIVFLSLFCITWLCGAIVTVRPLYFINYQEEIFSWLYMVSSILLAMFTVFFYCIARSDVRNQWYKFYCWLKKNRFGFRSRNISDVLINVPQLQTIPAVTNEELQIMSRTSSRSSKSTSHCSNLISDLNRSLSDSHGTKTNNSNLLMLHRLQYRANVIPNIIENPTSAVEAFYNPHQSTVARKFFRKQRKNMMKRNNLTLAKAYAPSSDAVSVLSDMKMMDEVDQRMFGTNSKVNNTNIHVEQIKESKGKNRNLYECNDSSQDKSAKNSERFMKQDVLKSKSNKKSSDSFMERNMRSVSQQCTLEYSSENISGSDLDKMQADEHLLARGRSSPIESFLTDDHTYCQIEEVNEPQNRSMDSYKNSGKNKNRLQKTFNLSLSDLDTALRHDENKPTKVYINPMHNLFGHMKSTSSRASSVSVSDLDELYQQIRRGPKVRYSSSYGGHVKLYQKGNSYMSDSEIPTSTSKFRSHHRISSDNYSDNVDTAL